MMKQNFADERSERERQADAQDELKDFYGTRVEVQPTHKSTSPLRLAKSFFRGLSTLDTLYLFDMFADLITEAAAAALKGRLVGAARKGHGISLKAALPRQWVEIWREMWNCKEGRMEKECERIRSLFSLPGARMPSSPHSLCVLNIKKNGNGYGCPASQLNFYFSLVFRLHFWAVLSRET